MYATFPMEKVAPRSDVLGADEYFNQWLRRISKATKANAAEFINRLLGESMSEVADSGTQRVGTGEKKMLHFSQYSKLRLASQACYGSQHQVLCMG